MVAYPVVGIIIGALLWRVVFYAPDFLIGESVQHEPSSIHKAPESVNESVNNKAPESVNKIVDKAPEPEVLGTFYSWVTHATMGRTSIWDKHYIPKAKSLDPYWAATRTKDANEEISPKDAPDRSLSHPENKPSTRINLISRNKYPYILDPNISYRNSIRSVELEINARDARTLEDAPRMVRNHPDKFIGYSQNTPSSLPDSQDHETQVPKENVSLANKPRNVFYQNIIRSVELEINARDARTLEDAPRLKCNHPDEFIGYYQNTPSSLPDSQDHETQVPKENVSLADKPSNKFVIAAFTNVFARDMKVLTEAIVSRENAFVDHLLRADDANNTNYEIVMHFRKYREQFVKDLLDSTLNRQITIAEYHRLVPAVQQFTLSEYIEFSDYKFWLDSEDPVGSYSICFHTFRDQFDDMVRRGQEEAQNPESSESIDNPTSGSIDKPTSESIDNPTSGSINKVESVDKPKSGKRTRRVRPRRKR